MPRRERARLLLRGLAKLLGVVLAAGETVTTDPQADSPQTNFGALGAGVTRAVTLRFETAGEVTAQLTNQKTGRLRIAGRTIDLDIKVGGPLSSSG